MGTETILTRLNRFERLKIGSAQGNRQVSVLNRVLIDLMAFHGISSRFSPEAAIKRICSEVALPQATENIPFTRTLIPQSAVEGCDITLGGKDAPTQRAASQLCK